MEVPIRVVARVKPSLPEDGNEKCLQAAPASSQIVVGYDNFYDFDAVFGEDATQKQIFNSCMVDIATNFFRGFNSTVICYGREGSGKTYTMTGPNFLWAMNEEQFGLIPQSVRHIFRLMNEVREREYRIHISYLIIIQELVYDLLSPCDQNLSPLDVLEDNLGNIIIPNLTIGDCANISEVLNCLEAGLFRKHSASSQGFDVSEAHTMFNFTLEQHWSDSEGRINYLYSKLSFVDLASATSVDQSSSFSDQLMSPAEDMKGSFHSDLKAFSNTVHCLVNKSYRGQIPFRDSRLTHILKESLGGNSITLIVCCVSSLGKELSGSVETLKFGSVARYVVNFPTLNLLRQNRILASQPPPNVMNSSSSRTNDSVSPSPTRGVSFRPISIPRQPSLAPPLCYPVHQPSVNGHQFSAFNGHHSLLNVRNSPNSMDTRDEFSNKDDIFKAQFEASQWHILVTSAETLLKEILQSGRIPQSDRGRIQSWLRLKEEADDCLLGDVPVAPAEAEAVRPLEVIEELSEPSDLVDEDAMASDSCSSETSLGRDFYLRLEALRESFLSATIDAIKEAENGYLSCVDNLEVLAVNNDHRENRALPYSRRSSSRSSNQSRSAPGSMSVSDSDSFVSGGEPKKGSADLGVKLRDQDSVEMASEEFSESDKENFADNFGSRLSLLSRRSSTSTSDEAKLKKRLLRKTRTVCSKTSERRGTKTNRNVVDRLKRISSIGKGANVRREEVNQVAADDSQPVDIDTFSRAVEESPERDDREVGVSSERELLKRVSSKLVSVSKGSSKCVSNIRTKSLVLKRSIRSHIFKKRNKSNQLCLEERSVSGELPGSVRRVNDELKAAKERLQELTATIKEKEAFTKELRLSEAEAQATKRKCEAQVKDLNAQLEAASREHQETQDKMEELKDDDEEEVNLRKRLSSLNLTINSLRNKIKRLEEVASISEQNEQKVKEVEGSIRELREEQEELLTKFREEMQWKEQLEREILREDRCARNPLCSSSQLMDEESDHDPEEDLDPLSCAPPPPSASSGFERRKFESSKKRKLANSTGDSQSETSLRGESRIGHWDKHKRSASEKVLREIPPPSGSSNADFIRSEIGLLRNARDALIAKRQKFDKKIRKGRVLGNGREEEKKLLEYDEAVEGLDCVIERKNEVLTGKATQVLPPSTLLTKNDLEERLRLLPLAELHFLLFRYFSRIIDLRIEFRKQELSFAELEDRYDEQNRYIQNLKAAYQQASLEMERRLTTLQREYQYKISYLLRQFNDDSSAGRGVRDVKLFEMEKQLYYYKHLSRELKDELKKCLNQGLTRHPQRTLKCVPGPSGVRNGQFVDSSAPLASLLPPPRPSDPSPSATPHIMPRRGRRHAMHGGALPTPTSPTPHQNTTKVTRQKNKLIILQNGDPKLGS